MCDRFKVLCDLMVMYLVSPKRSKTFDLLQNKRLSFNSQMFFIFIENTLRF